MSFTIFLTSTINYSSNGTGDTTYAINTTNFKEGKYKVSSTFKTGQQNITSLDNNVVIFLDIGSSPVNTILGQSRTISDTTYCIGYTLLIQDVVNPLLGYFYSTKESNPSIYYEFKPNTNFIRVQLREATNFDNQYDIDGRYVLALEFELIEEKK